MFDSKWVSFYLFAFAAIVQISLFIVERFFMATSNKEPSAKALAFFGLTKSEVSASKNFLIITAHHHLLIALLMTVGLRYVLKLQPFIAGPISGLAGFFMIYIGFVYLARSRSMWKVALLQIVPTILGFIFLIVHMFPFIRAMT